MMGWDETRNERPNHKKQANDLVVHWRSLPLRPPPRTLTAFFATSVCGLTTTTNGIPRLRHASAAPSNPPPFPAPAL